MKIALTFDIERDNPNFLDSYIGIKDGLLRILSLLDDCEVKGTFFCTGRVVERMPEYVKKIEDKGHEIGCHSLNHERLNQLNFENCQEIISQNKKLIEKVCPNSKILGFRAPYLKSPKFLFKILDDEGFKYDSSIESPENLPHYQTASNKIQEFHPSKYSIFFRLPYPFFTRKLLKKDLLILYFHPWEAIDMKNLIIKKANTFDKFKNILFRPDRWFNTGDSFLKKIYRFIKESQSKNVEFVTLNQLII